MDITICQIKKIIRCGLKSNALILPKFSTHSDVLCLLIVFPFLFLLIEDVTKYQIIYSGKIDQIFGLIYVQ